MNWKMTVIKQLYQLQEVDLELDSTEKALMQIASQLGESQEVLRTRSTLELERQHLEEVKHQQHSAEWEIDDIGTKLKTLEEKLYSGSIVNPKELANLQHEIDGMKLRRRQIEDKTLAIMDQVETTTTKVATISSQLETLEAEWQSQQQRLSTEMEQLKDKLSDLEHKRQQLLAEIASEAVELYHGVKKQKGTAIAKIERGICCGCRISLPASELQRARSAGLTQCSSCGRILFMA